MKVLFFLCLANLFTLTNSCDKSRTILQNPNGGTFGNYIQDRNYTQNTQCEWYIQAGKNEFVTLNFLRMDTECGYDYVFVYDGETKLLGSYSGKILPENVTASSGSMLIVFYSDTNYALTGFEARYSIDKCPKNCSNHGDCLNHKCTCHSGYKGLDCGLESCPDQCGNLTGKGFCSSELQRCICHSGYSGIDCSLDENNFIGMLNLQYCYLFN